MTRRRLPVLAAAAAAALAAPPMAAAQVEPPDAPREAAGAPLPRRHEPPNIFISPSGEPFRAGPDAPYAEADWFRGADADGDGRLTRAEFVADADRFFNRLDTNGDGQLDGFEMRAYEDAVAPEILPRIGTLKGGEGQDRALFHDRNGGVDTGSRRGGQAGRDVLDGTPSGRITAGDRSFAGAGAFGVLADPEPVQACDADLDGRVSRTEWRTKALHRFALLDTQGRGWLTLEGLPKTYVQLEREKAAARRAKEAARRQ